MSEKTGGRGIRRLGGRTDIRERPTKPKGMTELYRHFDEWGRLLYVGVSTSSVVRLWKHMEECSWHDLIATVTIERYLTRGEALVAERLAVREESPYFNKVHNALWHLRKWEHPLAEHANTISKVMSGEIELPDEEELSKRKAFWTARRAEERAAKLARKVAREAKKAAPQSAPH